MRFEEVIPALREGKKVRRKSWLEDVYIETVNGTLVDEFGFSDVPLGDYILDSDDWEVVPNSGFKTITLWRCYSDEINEWSSWSEREPTFSEKAGVRSVSNFQSYKVKVPE